MCRRCPLRCRLIRTAWSLTSPAIGHPAPPTTGMVRLCKPRPPHGGGAVGCRRAAPRLRQEAELRARPELSRVKDFAVTSYSYREPGNGGGVEYISCPTVAHPTTPKAASGRRMRKASGRAGRLRCGSGAATRPCRACAPCCAPPGLFGGVDG